jgi:hypothetical protein
VRYNAEGKTEGVRYEELTPVLVALAQQQQAAISALQARVTAQEEQLNMQAQQLAEVAALKQQFAELQALKRSMQTEPAEIQASDALLAMR